MVSARIDGHVSRPPAEVYELLADVRNELRWHPGARSVVKETDGPIGAGTVFRAAYRGLGEMRVDIVEAEPPTALTFRSEGRSMTIRIRFALAAAEGGTDLHVGAEAALHGALRVLGPLFGPIFRAELRRRPGQLERALVPAPTPVAEPA